MSDESIAQRWANAVFEIAREAQATARITREVQSFATTYAESQELRAALNNPLVPEPTREAILIEMASRMGVHDSVRKSLRLLSRKRRLPLLPEIAEQLAKLTDLHDNVVRAEVTSASGLSDDYKQRLQTELEKATGKKVELTFRQEPSLLGGIVTRIGDRVVDGSVRGRLRSFSECLLRT